MEEASDMRYLVDWRAPEQLDGRKLNVWSFAQR